MIAYEQRAATVLFNLIRTHLLQGPFLLPVNICPIVPLVFFKAGRPFEFIDIMPATLCMDHDKLISRWLAPGPKPAGLIYVRTYGAIFDTLDIFSEIKRLTPNALIVDDRCLCPPAFCDITPNNTDAVLFSTGYAKFVDVGLGGFGVIREGIPYVRADLSFNVQDLEKLIYSYKSSLARKVRFCYCESDWLDTRPPDISWGDYQKMVTLEFSKALEVKSQINRIFASQLPAEIQFPAALNSWRFNIHVLEKDALLDLINREGLYASGHYEPLTNSFGPGHAPVAEKVHRHVINLFNDRYFCPDQALKLVNVLNNSKLLKPGDLFS